MSNKKLIADDKENLLHEFEPEFNPLVEIGKRIGAKNLDVVMEVYGGQKPHIPMQHNFYASLEREQRNEEMRNKFTGNNYGQLSMDFKLSLRQTRIIVDKKRREYKRSQENMKPIKSSEAVYDEIKTLADRHLIPMHQVLTVMHDFISEFHQVEFYKMLSDEFGEQTQMNMDEAA